jgi:hypothetical protein
MIDPTSALAGVKKWKRRSTWGRELSMVTGAFS